MSNKILGNDSLSSSLRRKSDWKIGIPFDHNTQEYQKLLGARQKLRKVEEYSLSDKFKPPS
jgi:hypothetical protein